MKKKHIIFSPFREIFWRAPKVHETKHCMFMQIYKYVEKRIYVVYVVYIRSEYTMQIRKLYALTHISAWNRIEFDFDSENISACMDIQSAYLHESAHMQNPHWLALIWRYWKVSIYYIIHEKIFSLTEERSNWLIFVDMTQRWRPHHPATTKRVSEHHQRWIGILIFTQRRCYRVCMSS